MVRSRSSRRNPDFLDSSAGRWLGLLSLNLLSFACASFAQGFTPACPRPVAGSEVLNPPEIRSRQNALELNLYFRGDALHRDELPLRYCYVTDSGLQSPTLRVKPGDRLIIHFHNQLNRIHIANEPGNETGDASNHQKTDCSEVAMAPTGTNLHFHGLDIAPVCHQDDVIHTTIQPGETFDYQVVIPKSTTPGLYWYHPHLHGFTERQVQGGASGALIVEGDAPQNLAANLPERVLVLRDQPLSDVSPSEQARPSWDISLNFVPVLYKDYVPAKIRVSASQKELWRVLNAGAGTIFDLQVLIEGKPQTLEVLAIDGVPLEKTNTHRLTTDLVLPPASRAEFVVTTPPSGKEARLVTRSWDTGQVGDIDPSRPIATLRGEVSATRIAPPSVGDAAPIVARDMVSDLRHVKATTNRKLYFSELPEDPNDPDAVTYFFLTLAGQKPAVYDMGASPNIEVHQGEVEDWLIENRALEDHVFHAHQLHFQILEINGKSVPDREIRDTVNVDHWSGSGPYPSVRVRMDFRGSTLVGGVFPYHCHILRHEDMGMMGTIRVLPSIHAAGQK